MKKTRRKFTGAFKASVALEAIKGKKTMAELSQQFYVNAVMISKWKTEFLENMGSIFENGKSDSEDANSAEMDKLYAQIGQLKVENDFLKKSCKKLGILNSVLKWYPPELKSLAFASNVLCSVYPEVLYTINQCRKNRRM